MEWSTSKNGMEFILLIHDQICYGIHSIPFIFGTDGMNISLHSCQIVKKKIMELIE